MLSTRHTFALAAVATAALVACGGGGGSASIPESSKLASVPMLISDGASENWANIQVSLLSLSLTDSAGKKIIVPLPVTPYKVNLAQLDNLGDVLSNAQMAPGTVITDATLTISANPGDIVLKVSGDPESGFPAAADAAIDPKNIQIQGATADASGKLTVTVPIKLAKPFPVPAVGATSTSALNLEFDLGHPAFIVGHKPAAGGITMWAVNFSGPVKHKHGQDISRLVLRHSYGTVTSVSADNKTLNLTKALPTMPIVSPETAQPTNQAVSVAVDSINGTLFYDVDGKANTTIKDFSSVAALLSAGKYVRIAARYQPDGSLVATRVWTSAKFNDVFVSPEGHVLMVESFTGSSLLVDNAEGTPNLVKVDANTKFYFRNPGTATDVTPIGAGPAFLKAGNLQRGFKVRVTAVDVAAKPMLAAAIDIEAAPFDGNVSNATTTGFTLKRSFANFGGYANGVNLKYISSTTANDSDPLTGSAITGFKYWNFAYPTVVSSGPNAISGFVSAVGGSVSVGGVSNAESRFSTLTPQVLAYAVWGDTANPMGWAAQSAVLIPSTMPSTSVLTAPTAGGSSFTVGYKKGSSPVTVNFSTAPGAVTLAYQMDRSNDKVKMTALDISTPAGLTAFTAGLVKGAKVTVSGVPQAKNVLQANVVTFYTGSQDAD